MPPSSPVPPASAVPPTSALPPGLALGAVGVLAFSLTLPLTRIAVADLDPLVVAAGRAVVAALLAAIALAVARALIEGDAEKGILVCGSGAGVAVAACKVDGIRCAMAHDTYTAHQCVEHDNVNVLALGARVIGAVLNDPDAKVPKYSKYEYYHEYAGDGQG